MREGERGEEEGDKKRREGRDKGRGGEGGRGKMRRGEEKGGRGGKVDESGTEEEKNDLNLCRFWKGRSTAR